MTNINTLIEYAYPEEIIDVVNEFVGVVNDVFNKQKSGVLLVGSAARGELCWEYSHNKLQMYSDIEFLVAVDYKNNRLLNDVKQQVADIESKCPYGEAFHIDYTVIPWPKLQKVDKKFFVFESKQCGIDLGNQSVSDCLPEINRSNLNWKELNEVLLHRMNSMLHAIPLSLFNSTMSEIESRTFVLNIAKNTLDLTTWLHPYEADRLIAGFNARTDSWRHGFLEQSQLGNYLSEADVDYIGQCLAIRKSPDTQADAVYMLGQTLLLYKKGISYCKAMNSIDENKNISEVLPSIKLFDEYRLRQRVSQGLSLFINISNVGVIKFLRNTFSVRKGITANFSFYMLLAVHSYFKSGKMSQSDLNKAKVELYKLTRIREKEGEDLVTTWLNMRECFKKYQDFSSNF
ncbi:MAG: hypothetical protein L3J75_13075 [Methylococcaceae bacterium]|nr:hypothetical protein [Methylococcaceae bacterium]